MSTVLTPAPDQMARTLVLNMLRGIDAPTTERIRENASLVVAMLQARGEAPDLETLVRDVESLCNIWVGASRTLDDGEDHVEWLSEHRGQITWRFWERYRTYLEDVNNWAPRTIRRLDEITDEILGRMENPQREGAWDRRGMVVGQVQSGKTSNYTGLICKAADAGYRLIVVLAGTHNSLRSQTQLRLDSGFLGFDTQQRFFFDQSNLRFGVGALPGVRLYPVHSLTSSEESGDFKLSVARQANMMIGSDPILLVVKKNPSILRNLIRWATLIQQERHPESGRLVVPDVPLFVIDDEADHASVNTKDMKYDENGLADPELDPTAINGLIRKLLHRFEKSAYVGYTATPFANIFIYEDAFTEEHGADLFPKNFIVRIPAPENYIGPNEVFGTAADPAAGLEERAALPVVRPIDDHDSWIADRHRKDDPVGALPDSLRRAIRCFLLVCAARSARGQTDVHNSMLIHVTRFTLVQAQVTEQVKDELSSLKKRVRFGDGDRKDQPIDELRELWERDFVPTTAAFPDVASLDWPRVRNALEQAVAKIEVMTINGTARDALTYYEHRNGLSVIAVGGDKLSRGLTLEGLSVSYYLRASKMYDTLMQMGRWFGYRPGYLDLCRLYLPPELRDWYRDITAANQELLNLFDHMADVGGTPKDFGLRVKSHPDGLLVTAPAKMRHGKKMRLSFSDTISEAIIFHRDEKIIEANFRLVEQYVRQFDATGKPERQKSGTLLWRDVDASDVVAFLEVFITHADARKAQAKLLATYIRSRVAEEELVDWTVALISNTSRQRLQEIAGHKLGLIKRTNLADESESRYVIRRLLSPSDEAVDLSKEQFDAALERTKAARAAGAMRSKSNDPPSVPSGPQIRLQRSPRSGLLLLYPL
ncbi:MAG: Z1 domain-containing protein, partial [Actinomycetota bacterium]|nr:Z1 domain-containing protein [Actinomycetota bacterium]